MLIPRQYQQHNGECYSSSGHHTSGSWLLQVWDLASRKVIRSYEGHGSSVNTVLFHPDGTCIASGSADGSLKVRKSISIAHFASDSVAATPAWLRPQTAGLSCCFSDVACSRVESVVQHCKVVVKPRTHATLLSWSAGLGLAVRHFVAALRQPKWCRHHRSFLAPQRQLPAHKQPGYHTQGGTHITATYQEGPGSLALQQHVGCCG